MLVLLSIDFSLPLANPVLKFLIILLIILVVPVLFNRIRIPSILGLILAGAIIGPHALNLLERDSGIILSGTAGLLYIMFLAGLEVDMGDFKKHRFKSIVFGLYTFSIPMLLGIIGGLYILKFSLITSVLLASMFASHTLIAYPIIRKLGIARNIAVNITVGGTIITDTLALLVLAVIVGMTRGEVDSLFWLLLSVKVLLFGFVVLFGFPFLGRWFFRNVEDSVAQYIFVLAMVFLAAFLAEIAGVEGIIGAFLAGLSLNRLIPRNSALMNRVEFVGNAIFIPFFLIGIGMLIDYQLFFESFETLKVGGVMILIATSSKYLAAKITQKTFNFTRPEAEVIFGLSNAQAAATLAAVLIGYNIIMGEAPNGDPIRLLDESVLNGTILMILFTCTIATFSAAKGGKAILLSKLESYDTERSGVQESIMISLKNRNNVEELVNLAILMRSNSGSPLYALNILNNETEDEAEKKYSQDLLNHASEIAIASGHDLDRILRYDSSFTNGILGAIRENRVTDILLGLHVREKLSDSFLGKLTEGVLSRSRANTYIYKSFQPLNTLKRHLVFLQDGVEEEPGFPSAIRKIWQLGRNSGKEVVIYASEKSLQILRKVYRDHPIEGKLLGKDSIDDQGNFENLVAELRPADNLILVQKSSKQFRAGLNTQRLTQILNDRLRENSFILVYLFNERSLSEGRNNLMNASVIEPVQKLDEIFRQVSLGFGKAER
ncbi:cation:proton antiporter [Pontixanthobacter gangjinensis]|uniref:Cation:proton antiporter n=1 Tax=Christiangramia aestuarii TaxID=1028746 RepID=A0A7M3SYR2_9FLAO|nr:cation:proton antiporter [Christiangramia aestuarii]MUP41743.1 cation:proton antiporter [Christiangramia aestuarii]